MEQTWRPLSLEGFDQLVAEQEVSLDPEQQERLDAARVLAWQAILRRTDIAGDEGVWVLAKVGNDVLYFDDVEWGWNWSEVDAKGRILRPGGEQNDLQAVL